MVTRRSAPPPAAAAPVPWPAIGLGLAALTGGLFLLLRPRDANAASGPLITGGQTIGYGGSGSSDSAPGATQLPAPGASGLNPATAPAAALITRLQTSEPARQVFALQALLYSAGYDDDVPDGIASPTLDAQIARLNAQAGLTTASPVYAPTSLVNADNALQGLAGGGLAAFGLRLLPFSLPQAVLDQVNASAAALDPSYPAVQATAS